MADRSTGPVTPPVIDLTARSGGRPEAEIPHPADDTHRPDGPSRRRRDWVLLGGVALFGAVLGTALTYGVATLLPLPERVPDLSGALTAETQRLDSLTADLAALKTTGTKTQVSLDATIAQLDATQTGFDTAVAQLKAAAPAPVDLAPIESDIKSLKAQLEAVAAGASGADSGAIAKNLTDLETGVTNLTTRLNGVEAAMSSLRTDLDTARKSLADHVNAAGAGETGPALKLPLILSGLESAFAAGKPFATELTALEAVLPGTPLPDALRAAAKTGLSRPDRLLQDFDAALPAMLAARSSSATDWTEGVADWTRSLLALRPATEREGKDPEAVVSRLEAAMTRRDYAAATSLFTSLPPPMQAAAGPVAADIAAHAAADQLVTDLRNRALATAEQTP
jgi:hypothetical protein